MQICVGNGTTLKILKTSRDEWIMQLDHELQSFMRKIFAVDVATYGDILVIRGPLPDHLERLVYQEPFMIEDGTRRIELVHMQLISSWEAFNSILESRSRNLQGGTEMHIQKYRANYQVWAGM